MLDNNIYMNKNALCLPYVFFCPFHVDFQLKENYLEVRSSFFFVYIFLNHAVSSFSSHGETIYRISSSQSIVDIDVFLLSTDLRR